MTVSSTTPLRSPLAQPITALARVGSERKSLLAKLGVSTVEDLLLLRPRRYEDRSRFVPIRDLRLNEPALTCGKVVALGIKWFARRQKSIFELILDDGTARLHCRWWNLPFMERYFKSGDQVVVFGKPLALKPRTIDHPETEVIETGEEDFIHLSRITPIYPLTEGLPQRWLRALLWRTIMAFEKQIEEPWPELIIRDLQEEGPPANAATHKPPGPPAVHTGMAPNRATAIRWMHFPESLEQTEQARRRLALEEFIDLQIKLQLRRRNLEANAPSLPCKGDNRLMRPFLRELGFRLTRGQTAVLREIRGDLGKSPPMRRLLQGDVGSGKTVVAACTALMALESGYSAAIMAPTEILAEQHCRNFKRWFGPLGIPVELQTGSIKTTGRQPEGAGAASGSPRGETGPRPALYVGTHALLQPGFIPQRLGLAVIDEQQKFGVAQREALVRKGHYPHLLVMTATPIPRTLGLTLYGDLDLSVLSEPPPGRGKIRTFVRTVEKLPQVWKFIRERLQEGQQAYVVYPRVEESQPDVKAVLKEFENVQSLASPFRAVLLHGRLRSSEKALATEEFRTGRAKVLLATSLVEVGLDVPNATVMLIENAEQFGLAQLHQLRGRIGRGPRDSYCILVASAKTPDSAKRLEILEKTSDGFQIAEEDLKLRGPGELLGRDQSGLPSFRFGDLRTDFELLKAAQSLASKLG